MPENTPVTTTTLKDVRRRRMRTIVRSVLIVLVVLVLALAAFAWRFQARMKASLPQLDGAAKITGLSSDVTVERDALGVPTIRATNRLDAARALGFLHAQDRFFQMDLSRRRAAGELAELFGEKALTLDISARFHGFRALARESLARLPENQRALLEAYSEGVNAGLTQLHERPFEYLILRADPRPWLPEDSILVIHAMAIDLQHPDATYERTLGVIRDYYNNAVLAYFAPQIAPDDSALDGTTAPLPPIPKPTAINLREGLATQNVSSKTSYAHVTPAAPWLAEGSNSLALGGAYTANGAGMIENDMHLTLRVPNIWYRVSMTWNISNSGTTATADNSALRTQHSTFTITGITHPGAPVIVAGSNGHIAWGFTNSFADTSDIVVLTPDPIGPEYYYANSDVISTQKRIEHINVRGRAPVDYQVETSIWGPIIGKNLKGLKIALKWVFHDPAAANYDLLDLETATTLNEGINVAHRAGIPAQNILIADTKGSIAWTICGRLPDRFGYDGRAPATWSFGDRGWHGLLPPEKVPTVIYDKTGRLSTANQRLFGGDTLAVLGDGGGRPGQRGARLQSLLARIEKDATPRDVLAVALDDRAPYLGRWHKLLRDTLASTSNKNLARLRDAAGETWNDDNGRASLDSTAYPIVRNFREHVIARVLFPIFEPCLDSYPELNYNMLHNEEPVWNLVQQKPMHLLSPTYATWDDLLVAAADDTRHDLAAAGFSNPAEARWGAFNRSAIRHPLSAALPGILARFLNLDMPAIELPGDDDMPRVQRPSYGASDRFVVSPGDEANGIYQMPTGQSGHPLSPYYRAGHEAWAQGTPAPFLPGPAKHTLTLKAQ